jgi:predicted hydrocarbon binding protein
LTVSQDSFDFDRYWLDKFSRCLSEVAGETARSAVLAGSEEHTAQTSRDEVIAWTQGAMERLESLVDEEQARTILVSCGCAYPRAQLAEARRVYAETGDIDRVHRMLQAQFEGFLRETLQLDEGMVAKVVGQGWGLAGVRQGGTIIATKIPKSGYLVQYMNESDPQKRRAIYCHCPRVRDAVAKGTPISGTYCYCGAGFYKGVWEEILQQPVEVEVLESVMQGDEVCKIAIHLPQEPSAGRGAKPQGGAA